MKTRTLIQTVFIFLLFTINGHFLHGQILYMEEIPQVGKATYPLTHRNTYYVDINSSIKIVINKDTLRRSINREFLQKNKMTEKLMADIRKLNNISTSILKMSASFNNSLQAWNSTKSSADLDRVEKSVSDLADAEYTFSSDFIYDKPFMREKANAMFEMDMDRKVMFQTLAEEMQGYLNKQLDSVMKAEGVYVQVGAWIVTSEGTKSIHVDGFDEYPLGEYYEYPTFSLQLDSSQIKDLESMHKTFSENAGSYDQIFGEIGKGYGKMLAGLLGPVKDSADALLVTLTETANKMSASHNDIKQQLKGIESSVNDYLTKLKEVIESYKNGNIVERDKLQLLMRFYKDQDKVMSQTREQFAQTKTQVDQILITFQNDQNGMKGLLEKIVRQCSSITSTIETRFTDIKSGINSMVYGAKINSDLLVFGDKVKKLAVDDIPSSTSFSLKYTGKRKPGDQVILKVGAGTASNPKPKDMDVVYLHLLDAEPHIMMAIAYDFAWPVSKINEVPPNGPSYSILYKFRSRSPVYRNVFDFGVGLNFAAFDFNKDNIPEIASGFCISMLRDYIQGGWGFNFNANTGYYYVGLRIPLSLNSIYFSNSEKQEKQ